MACLSAYGSPSGTARVPSTSRRTSAQPESSPTMTGRPQRSASSGTRPKNLVSRRVHDDIGSGERVEPVPAREQAGEAHALAQVALADEPQDTRAGSHVVARQYESGAGGVEGSEGTHDHVHALARRELPEKEDQRCSADACPLRGRRLPRGQLGTRRDRWDSQSREAAVPGRRAFRVAGARSRSPPARGALTPVRGGLPPDRTGAWPQAAARFAAPCRSARAHRARARAASRARQRRPECCDTRAGAPHRTTPRVVAGRPTRPIGMNSWLYARRFDTLGNTWMRRPSAPSADQGRRRGR